MGGPIRPRRARHVVIVDSNHDGRFGSDVSHAASIERASFELREDRPCARTLRQGDASIRPGRLASLPRRQLRLPVH